MRTLFLKTYRFPHFLVSLSFPKNTGFFIELFVTFAYSINRNFRNEKKGNFIQRKYSSNSLEKCSFVFDLRTETRQHFFRIRALEIQQTDFRFSLLLKNKRCFYPNFVGLLGNWKNTFPFCRFNKNVLFRKKTKNSSFLNFSKMVRENSDLNTTLLF